MKRFVYALALVLGLSYNVAQAQVDQQMLNRDSIVELTEVIAMQFHPLDFGYDSVWAEAQQCSGLTTELTVLDFAWVAVPGHGFTIRGVGPYVAYAAVEQRNVAILASQVRNKWIVKHEMIHLLMWENELGIGHDDRYFLPCGVAQ